MTLFVGPNGSGKSLVLREIQQYAEQGSRLERLILDNLALALPNTDEIDRMLASRISISRQSAQIRAGQIRIVKPNPGGTSLAFEFDEDHLRRLLLEAQEAHTSRGSSRIPDKVFPCFVSLFTLALDGSQRFGLVGDKPAGDLQDTPTNHLAALFVNAKSRQAVRDILYDAFRMYFVIDPTNLGTLRIRMAYRPPSDESEEQGLDQRAREYHAAAPELNKLSDGVKAFTGIICALSSADFRIVVIDEPEAFLHPPLARKLGYRVTTLAAQQGAHIFAATHSSEFLMGAVESGRPLNIVRLTYESGASDARLLPAEELTTMMKDPLLRSANVLSALFHVGAVVCEGDADRCFYQEINTRLMAVNEGAQDSAFLNAQNKQTVRRIMGPLRRMGIAAAAIVDFDIIKGGDLKDLLEAARVPKDLQHALSVLRGNIERHFIDANIEMRDGGISSLSNGAAESCRSLLSQLETYGVFLVPFGEVEAWLPELGLASRKNQWLADIFDRMGSDPLDAQYVCPSKSPIWEFIRRVGSWIGNANRLGMSPA